MTNPFKNLKLFHRKQTSFPVSPRHKIKEAFTCDGIIFDQFDDIFNIPCYRGLTALAYYEEIRMRCTREYLLTHVARVKEILNSKSIKLMDLMILERQLEERLNLIIEPDLVYKLASIVYFRRGDNPSIYEAKAAQENIALWKKHMDMNAFFLSQPLIELIPYLKECEIDFQAYSLAVQLINQRHLENLSPAPLSGSKMNTKESVLQSAGGSHRN